MTRWLTRALALLVVVLVAGGLDVSGALAATREPILVSARKLSERPFRGIALVSVGDRVVCTGFVVAPRKVVTAAHCLVRDASSGKYKFRRGLPGNLRIYRAYSQVHGGTRYPVCGVARVWAHPKFVKRDSTDLEFGSRGHDYAVLTTASGCSYPSNAIMRMWATVPFDGQLRVGQKSKLAGYPADSRFNGMNGLNLWRSQGELRPTGSETRLLSTTGFVAQGMSGGPVWRSFGQGSPCGRSQCVIGILTECEVNGKGLCKTGDSIRRAVRITPTVKHSIKRR